MYIYIYRHIYINIYMYICVYVYIYMYIHIYIYIVLYIIWLCIYFRCSAHEALAKFPEQQIKLFHGNISLPGKKSGEYSDLLEDFFACKGLLTAEAFLIFIPWLCNHCNSSITHIHVMGQTNPSHWCWRKMGRKPHHGLPVPPHSQEEKPEAGLDDTQGLGEEVPFLTYRCFIETLQQCIILMARIIFWQVTKWDTTNSSLMSSLGLSCSQVRARIRSTRPCSSAVLGKGQR